MKNRNFNLSKLMADKDKCISSEVPEASTLGIMDNSSWFFTQMTST